MIKLSGFDTELFAVELSVLRCLSLGGDKQSRSEQALAVLPLERLREDDSKVNGVADGCSIETAERVDEDESVDADSWLASCCRLFDSLLLLLLLLVLALLLLLLDSSCAEKMPNVLGFGQSLLISLSILKLLLNAAESSLHCRSISMTADWRPFVRLDEDEDEVELCLSL